MYNAQAMPRRVPAAVAAIVTAVSLSAQQRAPQNESIRQDELRADLFFLAGDAMRGRLTDTVENRATADYIRSRFERMGLKPAGAGQLVLPELQPDDRHARRAATRSRSTAADGGDAPARGTARSSTRSASAPAAARPAPVVFAGFGITRAAAGSTTTTAAT